MIKAVAIDDEPVALKVIGHYCSEIPGIALERSFEDPREGMKYLNKFPADVLFLDIDMPGLNGLELYKSLKQDILVIFITARSEYAVEGFALRAADYLLKPFTFERFKAAVERARELLDLNQRTNAQAGQFIYLRADFSLVKVNLADIELIEALDDYLKIHIHNQKTLVARMTMKGILEKLPSQKFIRVHRSFIVPTEKIEAVRSKAVVIDGKEIPMGASFAEEVTRQFSAR